jgi:hypothetical protein
MNSCCSGKPKKEKKLIDQLKEDVKLLTLNELQLLQNLHSGTIACEERLLLLGFEDLRCRIIGSA